MKYSFDDLVKIMAKLRSDEGCPWDKQQTTHSLLPYLIEESFEFIDAAQALDSEHMCEELGDVLFQVVFHSQVAQDEGKFSIDDVVHAICEKMIRRHPHVFGNAQIETAQGVSSQWERIKASEKNNLKTAGASAMDKVSKSLPTLARAQELQRRAAKVGFDWEEAEPVFEKAQEEFNEFRAEKQASSEKNPNILRMEEEFGDILFSLVNVARHCGFNAAIALQRANSKFERRFREVEKRVKEDGKTMNELSLTALSEIWKNVKSNENH